MSAQERESHREVPETRFGTWFQGTRIWSTYVLEASLARVDSLLGPTRHFRTILDVGCGYGPAWAELEHRFRPELLIAVDLDPAAVERAALRLPGCHGRVQLAVGDATKLDLPDASVSLVFCHQTLHHVTDQRSALREFRRVLEPGGVLVLVESCRNFTTSLRVRALFRHPMQVQRTASEYLDLVTEEGFEFASDGLNVCSPWWSLPDLGMLARFRPERPREPTQLHLAARRPRAQSDGNDSP
jgi:SAM-dependent methyltransferase